MPVVVTAAETPLGRRVVARLVAEGAEVRALVGALPDEPLGVPTAVADWHEPERLGAVIEGAYTLLHLGPPGRVADLLDAAADTGLRRFVAVSPKPLPELDAAPYDTVVVVVPRARPWRRRPDPDALVDTLVAADRLRDVHGHRTVGPGALA